MVHSSFSFLFSSPSFYLRWTTILLLLNPLPFIDGTPTDKISNSWKSLRQKRQLNYNDNDIMMNKDLVVFEGLLGCKYDSDVCNQNEVCINDHLFGQCWNGKGSSEKIFALENDLHGLTNNKIKALDYTIEFLTRYHLDWKDFMTQCILSHVLSDHHEKLDRYDLELFYKDCLNKDDLLDYLAEKRFNRRAINRNNVIGFLEQNRLSTIIRPIIPEKELYVDMAEASTMNEPAKISVYMNEGHPGLLETLQINNNKQLLPKNSVNNMDTERVEEARGYIVINRDFKDQLEGSRLLSLLAEINAWPLTIFIEINVDRRTLTYRVLDNVYQINASAVADAALNNEQIFDQQLDLHIIDSGIGYPNRGAELSGVRPYGSYWASIILVTCAVAIFIMGSFVLIYYIKRNDLIRNKFAELTRIKSVPTNSYQDLCRQRMKPQSESRRTVPSNTRHKLDSESSVSSRSSTSSWIEEPVTTVNMDIMTGHLILSYMEDHLRNRHRLEAEWQSLCTDETNEERASCSTALSEINEKKNRYIDCIPYDHTRIRLANDGDSDYINASAISDSDPKCKYIATQGPTTNTTNAFWQMVWEQGSCVIVALTRPIENGITMCHHYWPVEGSARFNDFEVNLVSEHIWSEDYIVRSFYLKNIQTMETRTLTQFHFLTWDELCNPPSARAVLDFRRKVNKCFRGQSSPIIVHCNDGVGRTGAYILLDMVLNRICKGAREINIAATLEHIRDQRAKMVKTKEQFEFVFVAVAEEVNNLLKALPQ